MTDRPDVKDRNPELRVVPLAELVPEDRNPRKISEQGLAKLEASIDRFGFVAPIIVSRDTGRILAGHQRLKAATAQGLAQVPVVYVDMSEDDAIAYNVADNRLAQESEWDIDLLGPILQEADEEMRRLMGFEDDEVTKVFDELKASHAGDFLDQFGGDGDGEGKSKDPTGDEDYVQMTFACTPEQRDAIVQALTRVRKERDVQTTTDALLWLANNYMEV